MKLLSDGQFKFNFSKVLEKMLPVKKYLKKAKFKLGLLQGKASYKIYSDYKMTDEEL